MQPLSARTAGFTDSVIRRMTRISNQYGAVPGSSFFREPVNHLIRFHFAKKDETLNDALNRLEALRSKILARAAR